MAIISVVVSVQLTTRINHFHLYNVTNARIGLAEFVSLLLRIAIWTIQICKASNLHRQNFRFHHSQRACDLDLEVTPVFLLECYIRSARDLMPMASCLFFIIGRYIFLSILFTTLLSGLMDCTVDILSTACITASQRQYYLQNRVLVCL